MKDLNILMTCASLHAKGQIDSLVHNEDGRKVNVYVTNSSEFDMPAADYVAGRFIVPRIDDVSYLPAILNLCERYDIDIVIPCVSLELPFMAKNRKVFEDKGIKVSITSLDSLLVADNKVKLYDIFKKFMPKQIRTNSPEEAFRFYKAMGGKICCKAVDKCGGKGFAIVDNEKALQPMLFHRFGQKHFITLTMLQMICDNPDNDIVLQQYVDGHDYTVSLLADHGKIVSQVGYVGYIMEFGSIMYGETKDNVQAYAICKEIVERLDLDGNIGVDFILKPDGSVVLLEVNPRLNATLPFCWKAGCNLLYWRCKMLMGERIEHIFKPAQGLKMKKYIDTFYYE